ncbi:class II aldolase/adducin family protein [Sabulicella rubraurantiaca]|uniref:class II aldolase/adducin family protein n=1 Tax=Sabulicella rubraurantiaca TaxID=2811429 RepID=UPI002E2AC2B8|nr:class II aldolase/adducin family protein [Sabulicella rubraurantiaca]
MSGSLVAAARRLDALGFMPSKSGNLSVRTPRGFRITPAGLPYAELSEDDLVECDADGVPFNGRRRPSSEWRLHATLYAARPEVEAVVHTHSPCATALSCARQSIPPFHYMILSAGGTDIPCARHATFGTEDLAVEAAVALVGRRACLLANHGVVAVGASLSAAETLAREVENLASQYLSLLAAGLQPVLLDETELHEASAQFASYGR